MESFKTIIGIPAPLPMINVDTDMIIPKQFLKTIKRSGLGKNLFHELRYDIQGNIKNDFVLNWDPYKTSKILIAGANFGCGSSREHAPWSLLDFGFKSIIAPSFADIFYNNCSKNGVLAVVLEEENLDTLFAAATGDAPAKARVDLPAQQIEAPDGATFRFDIDAYRKDSLLRGLDDIGLTLQHADAIRAFETERRAHKPWLFRDL